MMAIPLNEDTLIIPWNENDDWLMIVYWWGSVWLSRCGKYYISLLTKKIDERHRRRKKILCHIWSRYAKVPIFDLNVTLWLFHVGSQDRGRYSTGIRWRTVSTEFGPFGQFGSLWYTCVCCFRVDDVRTRQRVWTFPYSFGPCDIPLLHCDIFQLPGGQCV